MNLKGKTAIVTGGAQGIGKEIARLLASKRINIAICDVNDKNLEITKREIPTFAEISVYTVDVSNVSQVEEMVESVVKEFGRVDFLINNAGVTRDALIVRTKEKDWDLVLNINLKGAFNCLKAVARPMMKQRFGRIVNISSVIGITGNAGQANYAASKAGVIGLTKSAAKELAARGINVNAIAPGYIQTAMTDKLNEDQKQKMLEVIPQKRFGTPQDIANLVLFLISPDSAYITGQVIKVDGGMVI